MDSALTVIHWCSQTLSGNEQSAFESLGNPCDLFSRSDASLYPKGHCSSALSPLCTQPIIHAQSYNNQTAKELRISQTTVIEYRAWNEPHVIKTRLLNAQIHSEASSQVIITAGRRVKSALLWSGVAHAMLPKVPLMLINSRSKGEGGKPCILQTPAAV